MHFIIVFLSVTPKYKSKVNFNFRNYFTYMHIAYFQIYYIILLSVVIYQFAMLLNQNCSIDIINILILIL